MTEIKSKSRTEELKESAYQKAPPPKKNTFKTIINFVILIVVLGWAFNGAKFDVKELVNGYKPLIGTVGRMFPPDFHKIGDPQHYSKPEDISVSELILPVPLEADKAKHKNAWWNNQFPQTIVGSMIQTIQMALAGTTIALFFAFPLSFLAASNTTPHPMIYKVLKVLLSLFRTIPELAIGLIFVSAVGLGAFAGTMALAFTTTTVLTKLLSESIEGIDEGVVEAIKATGANYFQTLSFAVVPQMLPSLISFGLYRFETNIRAASVLGLIGAGGMGYLLNNAFRTFAYKEACAIVIILIVLVITVDTISAKLRKLAI
ncbi:MAG: phosphonate ABC transporter, permease protein PhnE [Candidatus Sericytochromatia bacterium]